MIVKSFSRKNADPLPTLKYFLKGKEKESQFFTQKIRTKNDLKKIAKEFENNSKSFQKRKNSVYFYHEIIAINALDSSKKDAEILIDLAKEYLKSRAPNALCYAKVHHHGKTPHIHLLISANSYRSQKKIRLSKAKFQQIKHEIEVYQKKHYPQLTHSLAQTKTSRQRKKGVKEKRKCREEEREKRLQKEKRTIPTKKQEVARLVELALQHAHSQQDFESKLKSLGFTFYTRGKSFGVQNRATARRYRLQTLGIGENYERAKTRWSRRKERLPRLLAIERENIAREVCEHEFGALALAIVEEAEIQTEKPRTAREKELQARRLRLVQIQIRNLRERGRERERER